MPFTPSPYPADTTFTVGRRVKLQPRTTRITLRPVTEAQDALAQSGYTGPQSAVVCLGAPADTQTMHVPGGTHGIVMHAVEGAARVLFVWRDDAGQIVAALSSAMAPDKFVTQRGRPRLAGEPSLDPQANPSNTPAMPANSPAKAATPAKQASTTPDVADALEAIRQALQPQATVDEDKVRAIVDDMLKAPVAQQVRARRAVAQASSTNPIMAALQQRYVPGQEAPANALLTSPPSLGKSFTVREFAKQYDLYLEHGCTDDLDEIATLLGGPVPDGTGFLMVDGVLTQAVRAAAQGQTVLLLLDEVLRLGERPQEWLLSFLTGVKTSAGRVYRLRTRKACGGVLEVIDCPVENLHIVGAANLGPRHPQEAFWSRWDVVRFGFDTQTVQTVAASIATSYGVGDTDAQTIATRFSAAVAGTRVAIAANTLRYQLDMRALERGCQLAAAADAKTILSYIATRVSDLCAHWSIDLGETDPASTDAVKAIATLLTEGL